MSKFEDYNFFTDATFVNDPYPWFEYLRAKGPAVRLNTYNVIAVTGYEEGLAVFHDDDRFSAINIPGGPFPPLPFEPDENDITEQLEAYRKEIAFGGLIITEDPPLHTRTRSLLMGLINPKRMKENEAFLQRLADQLIDEFIDRGEFESNADAGRPMATLAIADLLGVPEEDHAKFKSVVSGVPAPLGGSGNMAHDPFMPVAAMFAGYVEARRAEPRNDILSQLSLAKYSDGTLPPLMDIVTISTFMFAAGQDTTVRLISAMLRFLGDDKELQKTLRNDRSLIPQFVEETLRLEGTVKADFRLAKVPVKVGDVQAKPGDTIMLLMHAMNRDPRKFENPNELRLDRKNSREHLAFGRGVHTCAGAPLARAEARIIIERLFDRTSDIRISEKHHGPPGARRYEWEHSYTIRGLRELHVEFTKA